MEGSDLPTGAARKNANPTSNLPRATINTIHTRREKTLDHTFDTRVLRAELFDCEFL